MRVFLGTVAVLALSMPVAQAAALTFTTVDNGYDPSFNQILGINNNGVVTGYYGSGAAGHPQQAYTSRPPYTAFADAGYPGAVQSQATGDNIAGAVVGFSSDTNTGTDANSGYERTPLAGHPGHYSYKRINNPLVASSPPVNQVLGINPKGNAVGFYNDANGMPHGYVYAQATGQFTPVTVKGGSAVVAAGINGGNLVAGFATFIDGTTRGFLTVFGGKLRTVFGVPGATVTQFLGVNDVQGEAVGFYMGADNLPHGLLYKSATGGYQTIDAPGAAGGTVINGINNKGQAVGFYTDAAGKVHGLVVGNVP